MKGHDTGVVGGHTQPREWGSERRVREEDSLYGRDVEDCVSDQVDV